jgi:uncharacterized FAD-dependent dehydrogenase
MSSTDKKSTTTWRVLGMELPVGIGTPESDAMLRDQACRTVGVDPSALRGFRIVKKALDARRARQRGAVRHLRFVVHADLVLDAGFRSRALSRAMRSGVVERAPHGEEAVAPRVHRSLLHPRRARVAVVGAGPGGLFAALVLARHGLEVVLVDRGSAIEKRSQELVAFHRTRRPNPESNLLFGEGGAGTYSDGKIYTRVDDPLEVPLLEELVACGAPPEIVYDSRAHIGTDRLHRILPAFRARMENAGVRCAWNVRVEELVCSRVLASVASSAPAVAPAVAHSPAHGVAHSSRRVRALATSAGEIACDAVVLALGHSARDTWAKLQAQGVAFEAKPFQLGLRIEHPQEIIDRGQFGVGPEAEALGAASYQLVSRSETGAQGARGVLAAHSFCMCPGGRIVASVNEPGFLCTNGMSNSTHSSPWANAALVATFTPADFGAGPFDGVAFQREVEARFFEAGGSDYTAPAQRASDFMAGRESTGRLRSSYVLGLVPARIDDLVPPVLRDALRHALGRFDRAIPGFAGEQGLFVGVESRSSGPVRMPRDRVTRRARGFANLYPVGEGAGYAGGIMSAALDGARSALALLEHGLE